LKVFSLTTGLLFDLSAYGLSIEEFPMLAQRL